MQTVLIRALAVSALLFTGGCKDGDRSDTNSTPDLTTSAGSTGASPTTGATAGNNCPGPGFLGCPCTDDGKCLEGLKCLPSINTCFDPSDLSGGGMTTMDSSAGSTTEPECYPGLESCPCAPGDFCAVGLVCVQGACQPFSSTTGETEDSCVDDYQPCDSQLNCCDLDQHCLDFTQISGGVVCAPECATHTECPSKCCGGVNGLEIHVCYSAPCTNLCADTCEYAGDGACDDGGPGSEFALCEYGTDCQDCGARASDGAPW